MTFSIKLFFCNPSEEMTKEQKEKGLEFISRNIFVAMVTLTTYLTNTHALWNNVGEIFLHQKNP